MLIFEQKNERVFSKTETGSGFEGLGGAPIHKLTCVFTIMTRGGSRIFLARGGGGGEVHHKGTTILTTIFTAFNVNSSTSYYVLLQHQ